MPPDFMSPILWMLTGFLPSGFALFLYIVRIEKALVRIQVELKYLKLSVPKCQPPSAQNTL